MAHPRIVIIILLLLGGLLVAGAGIALVGGSVQGATIFTPEVGRTHNYEYHVETPYSEYLTSYKNNGRGDNVVFKAWTQEYANYNIGPNSYWYEVRLNDVRQNGKGGTVDYESHCPTEEHKTSTAGWNFQGRIDFEPCTFPLLGDVEGVLKVTLFVFVNPIVGKYEGPIASHSALVRRGDGDMQIENNRGVFEEGQAVSIKVRTGSCGFTRHDCFSLHVLDPTGKDQQTLAVKEHAGDTKFDTSSWQTLKWTVPQGAFKPCAEAWSNKWTIELRNDIVQFAQAEVFAVDSLARIPPDPTIQLNPATLTVGQPAAVRIIANTSATGASSLKEAHVWAWYGSSNAMPGPTDDAWIPGLHDLVVPLTRETGTAPLAIIQLPNDPDGCSYDTTTDRKVNCRTLPDEHPPPGGSGPTPSHPVATYTATTQFTPSKEGQVQVRVQVTDTNCRASGMSLISPLTTKGKPAALNHPTTDSSGAYVAVAAVVCALLVAAFLVFAHDPWHKWGGIAATLLGGFVFIAYVMITARGGLFA